MTHRFDDMRYVINDLPSIAGHDLSIDAFTDLAASNYGAHANNPNCRVAYVTTDEAFVKKVDQGCYRSWVVTIEYDNSLNNPRQAAMANFTFYQQVNMANSYVWGGYISSHSSSQFTVVGDIESKTYYGSFTYSSTGPSGTITGYTYWKNGYLFSECSGANVSVSVQNSIASSGNVAGLKAYLLSGVDNISGSEYGDCIISLANNDIIYGNLGSDTIDGGVGADTLYGGGGDDIYYVDNSGDIVTESFDEGTDEIRSKISFDLAAKGHNVENLILLGTGIINATGNELNNTLTGNIAANLLDGGTGADTLIGSAGNDTYVVDDAGDVVQETSSLATEIDTVQSSITYSLSDTTNGNQLQYVEKLELKGLGNINGTGNDLANTILGNDGNNELDGLGGVDALKGGKGNDKYIVDLVKVGAGVTATAKLQDAVTENAGEGTSDELVLTALIDVNGNLVAQDLGLQKAITITLGANFEWMTAENTGTNKLNLTGNALDNRITGNAGDNVLNGLVGADTLIGGAGDDTYIVDNVGDVVTENANEGTDLVKVGIAGANGIYTLTDNFENATLTNAIAFNLTGNALANTLIGNAASNILDGGTGADILNGGGGNDAYIVDNVGDTILDTAGIDTVKASVSYTLTNNTLENLTLTGTENINGTGNALANILTGNNGINILTGLAGNDTYIIGAGGSIVEALNGGVDLVQSSATHTLEENVENLTLIGTGDINGTGNTQANILLGNSGDNILDGGAGNDTLNGGAGKDTLVVGWGDKVDGGLNFDTLDLSNLTGTYKVTGTAGAFTLTSTTAGDKLGKTITVANVEYVKLGVSTTESVTALLTPPDEAHGKYLLNGTELIGGGNTLDSTNVRDPEILSALQSAGAAASKFVDLSSLIAPGNDWNDQIFNENASSQTLSYKANDGSTVSGIFTQSGTTNGSSSSEGANLTLKSGDGAISLTMSGSDTSNQTNGASAFGTWSNKSSFTYLDTQGTTAGADDVKASYTTSVSGSWTAKVTGWAAHSTWADTQSYNHGDYSLAMSMSGVGDRAGSNPNDGNTADLKNNATHNFSNYSFKDAGSGFAISFSGSIVDDYVNDSITITFSKLGWATADYQLTVANLTRTTTQADSMQLDAYSLGVDLDDLGEMIDLSMVDDILTNAMQGFVLTGNNVVTITNNEGVTFDAGAGNDTVTGGTGNDILTGDEGNDILKGGLGADQLTGGLGADIFRFDTVLNATTNVDTIQDFSHLSDKIQLENAIFTKLVNVGALSASNFVSGDGAVAHDVNDFILYDTNTGTLSYDADGSGTGAAVQFATLTGLPALTVTDFQVA